MWSTHKGPGARGSTTQTNPTVSRKWVRQSIKKPDNEDLPSSSTSPVRGLRGIGGVSHKGLALDNLRSLNHGHKNLRFEHNRATAIFTKPEPIPDAKLKDVHFPVPENWKKKSFTTSKTKKTSFADSPENQKLVAEAEEKVKEAPITEPEVKIPEERPRSADGFMTVKQGIGTARGASPIYKSSQVVALPETFILCLAQAVRKRSELTLQHQQEKI